MLASFQWRRLSFPVRLGRFLDTKIAVYGRNYGNPFNAVRKGLGRTFQAQTGVLSILCGLRGAHGCFFLALLAVSAVSPRIPLPVIVRAGQVYHSSDGLPVCVLLSLPNAYFRPHLFLWPCYLLCCVASSLRMTFAHTTVGVSWWLCISVEMAQLESASTKMFIPDATLMVHHS